MIDSMEGQFDKVSTTRVPLFDNLKKKNHNLTAQLTLKQIYSINLYNPFLEMNTQTNTLFIHVGTRKQRQG